MNRIYKVKFSQVLNQFIVVSELARGKTKSRRQTLSSFTSTLKPTCHLFTLLISATCYTEAVYAAKSVREAGTSNVYIETNATSESAGNVDKGNILIGKSATVGTTRLANANNKSSNYSSAYSSNNIVIGSNTTSAGQRNIVLGQNAMTWGLSIASSSDQIAIGTNATASGRSSIALGLDAFTNSFDSIAIGSKAHAGGVNAIALGKDSKAAINAVSIGPNANATFGYSIALGMDSMTDQAATQEGNITVNGVSYDNSTGQVTDSSYLLSIGNANIKRQIKNVAPGKISATSTDAINGSQLYSIAKGLQDRVQTYFHVNSTQRQNKDYPNATAQANGSNAIAAGPNASTNANHAVALGASATANHSNAIALGANSKTDEVHLTHHDKLSFKTHDNTPQNIAFRGIANANSGSLSIGQTGKERQIHHVAAGRVSADSTDAINGSQLYAVAKYTGFNILENGSAKSRVNNDNTVNFTHGSFTTAEVTGTSDTTIKFNVVTQNITSDSPATLVTPVGTKAGVALTADVVKAVNNAGFKVQANTNTAIAVKNGDTLKFINGKNIEVSQAGSTITIKTVNSPTFNSINIPVAGNHNRNITIDGNGINLNGKSITNVASGGSTENNAANIGDATRIAKEEAKKLATTVTSTDQSISITGGQGEQKEYNLSVNISKVAEGVKFKYSGNTGGSKEKALSETVSFKGKDNEIITTSTNEGVTFSLAQEVKTKLDKADKSISKIEAQNTYETKANVSNLRNDLEGKITELGNKSLNFTTQSGSTSKKLGETLTLNGENGITTAVDNNIIKIRLDEQTKNKIDNALDKDSAAATYETKENVKANISSALASQKIAYKANNAANGQNTTFAQGFDFTNGNNTRAEVAANGVVKFHLNQTLTGITSIGGNTNQAQLTFGNELSLNNKKLTGLVDGGVNATSTEAVTGKQLHALQEKTLNITTQNSGRLSKKLGESLAIEGESGLSTRIDGDTIKIKIEEATKQAIDNALSKQEAQTTYETKENVSKISEKVTALEDGKITFYAEKGSNSHSTKLGENITIKAGSFEENGTTNTANALYSANNLATTIDSSGNLLIGFKASPTFDNINANSLSIPVGGSDQIQITRDGINAGNKPITQVGSGGTTNTNAANIGDATRIAEAKAKHFVTTVKSDDHSITITGGDNDKKEYNLSVNMTKVAQDVAFKYRGDTGGDKTKALSETVVFQGTTNEIETKSTESGVSFKLADDVKNKLAKADKSLSEEKAAATYETQSNVSNIKTALDGKITALENKQLTFTTQNNGSLSKKLGESVAIEGENGIETAVTDSKIKVKLTADTKSKIENALSKVDAEANYETKTGVDDKIRQSLNTQTIAYKANAIGDHNTTFAQGFNFSNGDNTKAEVGGNGVVKFSLNSTLSNITSIEGQTGNAKLTFGDNLSLNSKKLTGLANATIGASSTDAVTGQQLFALQEKPLIFAAQSGANFSKKLGETVSFEGVNGLSTLTVGDKIQITIENDTKQKIDNALSTQDAEAKYETKENVDKISQNITALQNGVITFKAGKGNQTHATKLGGNITIKAGSFNEDGSISANNAFYSANNLATTIDGAGNLLIGFKDSPTFNQLTANSLTIPTGGANPIVINQDGINAGEKSISNLGSGGDVGTNAANIADAKEIADKAAKRLATTVSAGNNTIVINEEETNGKKHFNISVNTTQISEEVKLKYSGDSGEGENKLSERVKFEGNADIVTAAENNKVTFTLSTDTKAKIDKGNNAVQDIKIGTKANDNNTLITLNQTQNRFNIIGADNIQTNIEGENITVKLAKEIADLTSATFGNNTDKATLTKDGLTLTNGNDSVVLNDEGLKFGDNTNAPSIRKTGINAGNTSIENLKAVDLAENGTAAATTGQLHKLQSDLTNKTIAYKANGNNQKHTKLSDGFNFTNGTNTHATVDEDGVVTFHLNSTLTGIASISNDGSTLSIANNGFDFGNKPLSNVTKGSKNGDVVTYDQLQPLANALNATVGSDGAITAPSYALKSGNETATTHNTVGGALNALDTALSEVKNTATNAISELKVFATSGKEFSDTNANVTLNNQNPRINIIGEQNIETNVSENDIKISLSKNISLEQITLSKDGNHTTIDGNGIQITGGPTLTKSGLDMANNTISQLSSGIESDANKHNLANLDKAGIAKNAVAVEDLKKLGWLVAADTKEGTTEVFESAVRNTDTVKFTGSDAIKITGQHENGINTLKVDIQKATLNKQANGSYSVNAGDENKLLTAEDITTALNNSAFNVTIGQETGAVTDQEGKTEQPIQAGNTLTLKSGKNLIVKQNQHNITFATADNVTFTQVNATSLVVGDPAHADKQTTLTANEHGLSLGNKKLTDIAKGGKDADAVNAKQLREAINLLGGGATLGEDGNITAPTYALKTGAEAGHNTKNYTNVSEALTALDNALEDAHLSLTTDGTTDATNINLKKQKLKVVGENGTTIAIKDQTITIGIDSATIAKNTELSYRANNATEKKTIKLSDGLDFTNGTNTRAEVDEQGVVKFHLNSTLTGITSINAGEADKASLTFNNGNIAISGKLTGLTDGAISASSTDVITGKQLHGSVDSLAKVLGGGAKIDANGKVVDTAFSITQPNGTASTYDNVTSALEAVSTALNLPLTFAGNQGNTTRTLNTTIKFYAGLDNNALASNKNLRTNVTEAGVELLFANAPEFDSIKLGNTGQQVNLSVDNGTLKVSGANGTDPVKISHVANGTADNDAINAKQFKDLITTLGGESKLNNDGTLTAPTYSLNAGKTTPTTHHNVSSALSALDHAITNIADTALLSYRANEGETKTVSLKTGLHFKNGKNSTALVEDNGVVKVDVNTTLNDMSAIHGGTNKGSLLFNENSTKLQAGEDQPTLELTPAQAMISGGKDKASATFTDNAKISAGDNKANLELKDNEGTLQAGNDTQASVKVKDNQATLSAGKDKASATLDNNATISLGENKAQLALTDTGTAVLSAGKDKASITLDEKVNLNDRVISGVNNGIQEKDAVNRSQLNPLAELLGANIDPNTGGVSKPTFSLNAGETTKTHHTTVGSALTALDDALTKVKSTADNAIATFEVGDGTKKLDITKTNNRFDITGSTNIETSVVENNQINVRLKKDIQALDSLTFNQGDKQSTVKLDKNGFSITPQDNPTTANTLKIVGDKNGGTITGLENRTTENTDYGTGDNLGRAATEGAVKELSNQLGQSNDEINKLKQGESGPVVYTDAQGEPLVKANDKYYYAKDMENGTPKANATAVDKPTHLSVKNADGTTTNPVVLGNIGNGLAKDPHNQLIPAHQLTAEQLQAHQHHAVNVADLKATTDALVASGIQVGANTGGKVTHKLGHQVDILGAKETFTGEIDGEQIQASAKNILTQVSQDAQGKTTVQVGLAKEIKGLEKLVLTDKSSPSNLILDGKSITLTSSHHGENHPLQLSQDEDGGKLTGLANRTMSKDNTAQFGVGDNAGRAATEGAVKQLYDQVENGEIGPMVYTDQADKRLIKVGDRYYRAEDVVAGQPKTGASAVENPRLSLRDIDGSTQQGVVLANLAHGDISVGSQQAVNGDQLAALGKVIGENHLDIQAGKQQLKPSTFADMTGADGTATPPNNMVDAIQHLHHTGTKYAKVNAQGESALAKGQDAIAIGSSAKAEGDKAISIGQGAKAESAGSVAIGEGAIANQANVPRPSKQESYGFRTHTPVAGQMGPNTKVLSVGRQGDERQIQHVAPGVVSATSTDAVNGSQLYQTNQHILHNSQKIDNLAGNVKNLYVITGKIKQEMRSGVASAVATASLPAAYIPGKSLFSIAGGSFQGEQAVAVGLSRVSDNGKVIFKLNTGYSNGSTTMGVGAGFLW
ncbi:YadA-like family protein [Pasteurella sp. PK-2025]|uniref:YadA-like family protein n=1 Tax=Pasteurella sp. PK-2025 TaxID=3413133 RepID=UPI003C709146